MDIDNSGTAGKREIVRLLITIRERWRTEGLMKEMEREMGS